MVILPLTWGKREYWSLRNFHQAVFANIGYFKKQRQGITKMWPFVLHKRIMALVFFSSMTYISISIKMLLLLLKSHLEKLV